MTNGRKDRQTDLECVNESKVVESDVIVIVLDVAERFLVIPHQSVDLCVLTLLHLVTSNITNHHQHIH